MAEIPDRVPGGVILASYANDIRDRAAMRYADPTARDASNPLPAAGELAWVDSLGHLQVFDGSLWQSLQDAADLLVEQQRLDVLEQWAIDPFDPSVRNFSGTVELVVAELTIPATGDWLIEFDSLLFFADTSTQMRNLSRLLIGGLQVETWLIQSQADVVGVEDWSTPAPFRYLANITSGQVVEMRQQMTTVGSDGSVSNSLMTAKRLPDGTIPP